MTLEELKEHCEKTINPNGKLIFDTNSKIYKEHKLISDLIKEHEKRKWILCSERLPEDYDSRYYLCVVKNQEENLPMFCQYEEGYGFGYWNDIYNAGTLGYVGSEFITNEELGYEEVIAWMPLPQLYCDKNNDDLKEM